MCHLLWYFWWCLLVTSFHFIEMKLLYCSRNAKILNKNASFTFKKLKTSFKRSNNDCTLWTAGWKYISFDVIHELAFSGTKKSKIHDLKSGLIKIYLQSVSIKKSTMSFLFPAVLPFEIWIGMTLLQIESLTTKSMTCVILYNWISGYVLLRQNRIIVFLKWCFSSYEKVKMNLKTLYDEKETELGKAPLRFVDD